jgi:hypothetical protein
VSKDIKDNHQGPHSPVDKYRHRGKKGTNYSDDNEIAAPREDALKHEIISPLFEKRKREQRLIASMFILESKPEPVNDYRFYHDAQLPHHGRS